MGTPLQFAVFSSAREREREREPTILVSALVLVAGFDHEGARFCKRPCS